MMSLKSVVLGAVLAFCPVASQAGPESEPFGLLIMAHGGSAAWNQSVHDAAKTLEPRYPVEVALGMADACSLQESVRKLEARGVRRIGVVRLFISGESWFERTEQILGIRPGAAPARPGECSHAGHGDHHSMAEFRVASQSAFAMSKEGLVEAPEVGAIVAERAAVLSRAPEKEDVLILAHGPGDDAENRRWLDYMEARAAETRKSRPYHSVVAMTLREDWPEKRQAAEQRIRAFVTEAIQAGRTAIVIPFRLSGFGPYAEVLKGLDYRADRTGLLPHANVERWIERQANELRSGSFVSPKP